MTTNFRGILAALSLIILCCPVANAGLSAGAAAVEVTPLELPVIQNGGFLERQVRLVADPIFARALVIDGGDQMIALAVVDSCMMDREFCDRVKALAQEQTGIAKDKIMLSATHTHSAPSVMNYCLGTRADPKYTEFLPGKIVEVIVKAKAALRPAKAAWAQFQPQIRSDCRVRICQYHDVALDQIEQASLQKGQLLCKAGVRRAVCENDDRSLFPYKLR